MDQSWYSNYHHPHHPQYAQPHNQPRYPPQYLHQPQHQAHHPPRESHPQYQHHQPQPRYAGHQPLSYAQQHQSQSYAGHRPQRYAQQHQSQSYAGPQPEGLAQPHSGHLPPHQPPAAGYAPHQQPPLQEYGRYSSPPGSHSQVNPSYSNSGQNFSDPSSAPSQHYPGRPQHSQPQQQQQQQLPLEMSPAAARAPVYSSARQIGPPEAPRTAPPAQQVPQPQPSGELHSHAHQGPPPPPPPPPPSHNEVPISTPSHAPSQPRPQPHWQQQPSAELLDRIDKLCGYLQRNGPQFEMLLLQREANNPGLSFIRPDHPDHPVYLQRRGQFGLPPPPSLPVARPPPQQHYPAAHPQAFHQPLPRGQPSRHHPQHPQHPQHLQHQAQPLPQPASAPLRAPAPTRSQSLYPPPNGLHQSLTSLVEAPCALHLSPAVIAVLVKQQRQTLQAPLPPYTPLQASRLPLQQPVSFEVAMPDHPQSVENERHTQKLVDDFYAELEAAGLLADPKARQR